MSEEILAEFEKTEEITMERILSQLMAEKKTPFHTEIHNPLSMSTLEILTEYFSNFDFASKILKKWIDKFKVNMVAYKRKRAGEIVEAYKKSQEGEEKSLSKILLGK